MEDAVRVHELRGRNIFTVDDVLTHDECDVYIRETESMGYSAAPITTSRGPVMNASVRNNTRFMIDSPEIADDLWPRVRALFEGHLPPAIGLNERIRFYRYDPGQRFAAHLDGAYRRTIDVVSLYTFMIYLNDDFEGGSTTFNTTGEVVRPRKGSALFFAHRQLHTGTTITRGRKYVLRTDVMFDLGSV